MLSPLFWWTLRGCEGMIILFGWILPSCYCLRKCPLGIKSFLTSISKKLRIFCTWFINLMISDPPKYHSLEYRSSIKEESDHTGFVFLAIKHYVYVHMHLWGSKAKWKHPIMYPSHTENVMLEGPEWWCQPHMGKMTRKATWHGHGKTMAECIAIDWFQETEGGPPHGVRMNSLEDTLFPTKLSSSSYKCCHMSYTHWLGFICILRGNYILALVKMK